MQSCSDTTCNQSSSFMATLSSYLGVDQIEIIGSILLFGVLVSFCMHMVVVRYRRGQKTNEVLDITQRLELIHDIERCSQDDQPTMDQSLELGYEGGQRVHTDWSVRKEGEQGENILIHGARDGKLLTQQSSLNFSSPNFIKH